MSRSRSVLGWFSRLGQAQLGQAQPGQTVRILTRWSQLGLSSLGLSSLGIIVGWLGLDRSPAFAQNERLPPPIVCPRAIPLMPVAGDDPEVIKRVSPPGLLFSRANWNTDFIVPSNLFFPEFRANIFFKGSDSYHIEMYLKYADGTADKFYDERISAQENQLLQVPAYPRRQPGGFAIQPYQVNILLSLIHI